ncbi:MAG: P-II family nitrogen regulator [Bacillota bacterium]|nr:P-II family nitrogen regulator [Bacillota bacterium]
MVKVECIIRPDKIAGVKDAISNFGVHGMTVTEVIGCGFQMGHTEELNWNTELNINLLPKTKIEMVVPDEIVEQVISAIIKAAKTGEIGDGKIFTSPITDAIRIRTEERGDKAI